MDNYICVDYLCFPQSKIHVADKGQIFESRTFNNVSGIGINELFMYIILCHGFVNNKKSVIILSCHIKLIDYYL